MDSSIRLDTIFGITKVKYSDLTPEEQVATLHRILDICKPYLPYMAGFVPLSKALLAVADNENARDFAMGIPGNLSYCTQAANESTHCLRLALLSLVNLPPQGERVRWKETRLFLTRSGILVVSTATVTREEAPGDRCVEIISWPSIDSANTPSENGIPWSVFTSSIYSLLESVVKCIERKTEQLAHLNQVKQKLLAVTGRIGMP